MGDNVARAEEQAKAQEQVANHPVGEQGKRFNNRQWQRKGMPQLQRRVKQRLWGHWQGQEGEHW